MGSNASFESYRSYGSSYSEPTYSSTSRSRSRSWDDGDDYEERARKERERQRELAEEAERAKARTARLEAAKKDVDRKSALLKSASSSSSDRDGSWSGYRGSSRPEEDPIDKKYVKNRITKPNPHTQRVHIVLVDNSGSNEVIAQHIRASSQYLNAMGMIVDAQSEIAYVFFSDHGDDDLMTQEVGYTSPGEEGGKYLKNSMRSIKGANGYDEPEAIECVLRNVSNFDFGSAAEKHLYLVTDVLAHGMGMRGDHGCPHGVNWKDSVDTAHKVFNTVTVIGCSKYESTAKEQLKFVKTSNDLIDLSEVRSQQHRLGIVGNAILFAMAKNRGTEYAENFLSALYEKWLDEPIFGANTDLSAKTGISRFVKFLGLTEDEEKKMESRIFS